MKCEKRKLSDICLVIYYILRYALSKAPYQNLFSAPRPAVLFACNVEKKKDVVPKATLAVRVNKPLKTSSHRAKR